MEGEHGRGIFEDKPWVKFGTDDRRRVDKEGKRKASVVIYKDRRRRCWTLRRDARICPIPFIHFAFQVIQGPE